MNKQAELIKSEIERRIVEIPDANDGVRARRTEKIEYKVLNDLLYFINSLPEEPVSEVWHDASEEPDDMSHCLIFYGCKESVGHYLHYEPVLYNKKEKMFVTSSFPHPTGYKVEQKSFDGGCVAEVYKDRRDRISISDITQWCYLYDLNNLSNLERTVKNWKEPVSEDLEKAAKKHAFTMSGEDEVLKYESFKAGANWKEQQMMKGCVMRHELSPFDIIGERDFSVKKEKFHIPDDMDKECIKLCKKLNSLSNIRTTESCCGHLKEPYRVFFQCDDFVRLGKLFRCVNRNYSDGKWRIEVDGSDGQPCYTFLLTSKEPFSTNEEMEESVNSLIENIDWWESPKFRDYFRCGEQKSTTH